MCHVQYLKVKIAITTLLEAVKGITLLMEELDLIYFIKFMET